MNSMYYILVGLKIYSFHLSTYNFTFDKLISNIIRIKHQNARNGQETELFLLALYLFVLYNVLGKHALALRGNEHTHTHTHIHY